MLNRLIFKNNYVVTLMALLGTRAQIKKHDFVLNLCLMHCALAFCGLQYSKLGSCMKQTVIKHEIHKPPRFEMTSTSI